MAGEETPDASNPGPGPDGRPPGFRPPVGYLVNHPGGVAGRRGAGYDYLLAANGVFVEARGPSLEARTLIAPASIPGLEPSQSRLELVHGPVPRELLNMGIAWFRRTPGVERYFAIAWEEEEDGRYTLRIPPQEGAPSHLTYRPQEGAVLEFHSHGVLGAFFSAADDRDEQGFRIYGAAGRLDRPLTEITLRLGIYGHFRRIGIADVFGPGDEPERMRETGNGQTGNGDPDQRIKGEVNGRSH